MLCRMDENQLSIALKRLGKNVKLMRVDRDMTQETLALEAGIARANVSKLEHGDLNASAKTILRLAAALQVPPGDLWRGVGEG